MNTKRNRLTLGDAAVFIPFVIVTGIMLAIGVVFGVLRWKRPHGKIVGLISAALLIALVIFTAIVLFLAGSAEQGTPL